VTAAGVAAVSRHLDNDSTPRWQLPTQRPLAPNDLVA